MRKEKIHTTEIDALLKANIDGLEAVIFFVFRINKRNIF